MVRVTDHPAEPERGPGPVSHRSTEIADPVIADLAVTTGCGQLESGAHDRRARLARYDRLSPSKPTSPSTPAHRRSR